MGHFIEVEHRYLSGQMSQPESESFLQPDKITPSEYKVNFSCLDLSYILQAFEFESQSACTKRPLCYEFLNLLNARYGIIQ